MLKQKIIKYTMLVIYIALIAFIFIQAGTKGETSKKTSDKVTDTVIDVVDTVKPGPSIKDKYQIEDLRLFVRKAIGHYGLFLLLGVVSILFYYLWLNNITLANILILASGFVIGGISEFIQKFTDARVASMKDVVLDYVGYLSGYIITCIILIIVIRLKSSKKIKKEKLNESN